MIVWAEKLYVSSNIEKKKERLMRRIRTNRLTFDLHCIICAENEKNLLEIIPAKELKHPHYQRSSLFVVGLAKGKDEAKELVRVIIEDVFTSTGDFDVRTYFK